ncbi:hypothetical protein CW751_04400 [Brumimicrobium salinarum]|uniref:YncE family protein n=1 Tax=Brumimicrobium salinarum TaxID=2058658 RepID=A0A2I0R403_9FLAO|nr:DUF5074 domain-containing protein [Brumimicrobium salinarum]PKR81305.1 hypothetical protein CW751_04400 [Brumimicrobium salinarum]
MDLIKYIFIALLLFTSCKKDKNDDSKLGSSYKNGLLILNEGLFQHNNSSLSWLDLSNKEITNNVFLSINDRPIGDTGNDMIRYGSKIYICVTGSSTLEVIDKNTLKSIKQIPFNYNNQAQEPRRITAHNDKVFVSSFDGYVTAIDTTSLSVHKRIKVGRNPEGICANNNALFVANSGGLDFDNPDSTVFEIDLNTLEVVDTFWVGANPGDVIADAYQNIYVIKRGDYESDPSELVRINLDNRTVENLEIPATSMNIRNNKLYISYYNFSTNASSVSIFDCNNQSLISSNFINSQEISTLYGVIPYKADELICLDAMNYTNSGYLRFFNSSGQLTNSINVGLNPNKIIHYE